MLTDEEIIECWNEVSFEHAATKNAFGRAVEAAVIEKLKTAEPVYYEYRYWYGPQTVINGWGDWERVNPRNALCTIADAVNELEHYISAGYKYELRALYAIPAPLPEEQIAEKVRNQALEMTLAETEVLEMSHGERIEKLTAQVGVLRDGIEAYLAANDPSEFGCTCDLSVGYICGPCFADKQLYNALAAWREMTTDHIKPAGKEDQAVYDSIARNYYK